MAALGLSLIVMIVYGYRIWWQRATGGSVPRTLIVSWKRLSVVQQVGVVIASLAIGWALPLIESV